MNVLFKLRIKQDRFIGKSETVFQVKTKVLEMLEEVDHCRFYGKGEYASCLKTEISNRLNSTLKCIPPWFGFEYKKVFIFSFLKLTPPFFLQVWTFKSDGGRD